MAMKSGKIYTGEDSESEEEEDDVPMWMPTSIAAPVVNTVVVPDIVEPVADITTEEPVEIISSPKVTSPPSPVKSDVDPWQEVMSKPFTEDEGIAKMSLAATSKLQSVLDGTLAQMSELVESQEHLLEMVIERNGKIVRNEKIAQVEQTMSQVSLYFQKIITLKIRMNDITTALERMKKQADYLQIEAQSRAIAKEDRRDKMSQWNKLLSAKPSTDLLRKMEDASNTDSNSI
ncbi:hypothetical protein THRCLA_07911 [Thraustotheca clavata]|uniref:Uncharacterized protein n=1 Tax=Thraustotheca clavata TaxID=74557 RepID=A0A1V9ZC16_9STRA|nr:hypothetical protein THRCLA_07911 [Thraustotheca clavata]